MCERVSVCVGVSMTVCKVMLVYEYVIFCAYMGNVLLFALLSYQGLHRTYIQVNLCARNMCIKQDRKK